VLAIYGQLRKNSVLNEQNFLPIVKHLSR
jgi:hypothetical protein